MSDPVGEQSELQQLRSELQVEKQRKAESNLKARWFLIGLISGGAVVLVMAFFVLAVPSKKANKAFAQITVEDQAFAQLLDEFEPRLSVAKIPKPSAISDHEWTHRRVLAALAASDVIIDGQKRIIADYNVLGGVSTGKTRSDPEFASAAAADYKAIQRFTILYEPTTAPAAGTSPLELLNLLRPGLGTIAAKLSQSAQPQSTAPRWVITGYAKPVFVGNPQGVFYSWLNVNTNEVKSYVPEGTPQ